MNNGRHHLTIATSCFCLVGGCVQGPDYIKPTVEIPGTYRFAQLSTEAAQQPAWWNEYHDPYLDAWCTKRWTTIATCGSRLPVSMNSRPPCRRSIARTSSNRLWA